MTTQEAPRRARHGDPGATDLRVVPPDRATCRRAALAVARRYRADPAVARETLAVLGLLTEDGSPTW